MICGAAMIGGAGRDGRENVAQSAELAAWLVNL
jgi:hypothetical protein